MRKFMENIKEAFNSDDTILDRADIVQTIMIVAGFAIITISAVTWIGSAILNKGADVAACIEGSNSYNGTSSTAVCSTQNHAGTNSFENDDQYKKRYGG